jgi:protein O-GlcNAc transferase
MLSDKVRELVSKENWLEVDGLLIPILTDRSGGLEAVLLYSATLRARNTGAEANKILADASYRTYEAELKVWSQFAEELIQSGLWNEAKNVISKITKVDAGYGNFLQIIFFRETENWIEFEKNIKKTKEPFILITKIQEAWASIRRNNLKKANEILLEFTNQENPAILKLIARYNIASNNIDSALKQINLARKIAPMDWEALALEGVCNQEKALENWEVSLLRQPSQLETLVNRANYYAQIGEWNKASEDCERALKVKFWNDLPIILWIKILLVLNRRDEALTYLEEKIQEFVTPGRLALKLDLVRSKRNSFNVISLMAENALKKYPQEPQILLSAGAAFQVCRQLDKAASCYKLRLSLLPDDISTLNNLAQLFLDRGDIELAIETWQKIIDSSDQTVQLNFALALQQRGNVLEAEDIYRKVLEDNENSIALRGLADVLALSGDTEQAWNLIAKALRNDPNQERTWLIASRLQAPLGYPEKIEFFLEQGEKNCPEPLILRKELFNLWREKNETAKCDKFLLQWAENNPEEYEYWLMIADVRYDRNDFDGSELALQKATQINWQAGGSALVRFYESRERLGSARKQAEQMVRQDPSIMKNHGLLAEVLYRQERYDQALNALDEGLKREPFRLSLLRQKVNMLLSRENFSDAIDCASKLLAHEANPPHIALLLNTFKRSHQYKEAIKLCEEMLIIFPENRSISIWLVESLIKNKELDRAIGIIKSVWTKDKRNLSVAAGYINCLIQVDQYEDAFEIAQTSVNFAGQRPDGILVLTQILKDMGKHEESLHLIEEGVKKFPRNLALAQKKADCLRRLKRNSQEQTFIIELIEKFPPEQILPWACNRLLHLSASSVANKYLTQWQKTAPDSLVARWAAFQYLKLSKRTDLAHKMLDALERRKPGDPDVLMSRASLYSDSWRMSESIALVRNAIELRPSNASYVETLINLIVKAGAYEEFDVLMNRLKLLYGDLRYNKYANFFFNINCYPEWSEKQIFQFYDDWYKKSVLPSRPSERAHLNDLSPHRKLRIGYVSPDFRRHAVSYFSEPLLIQHDRTQFELFAFAHLEIKSADETTKRFKSYVDHWIETAEMTTEELEKSIRENQIDILIDLAGHTANNSLAVFSRKPAPLQASYIFGAGQTTGLPEVDYLISDKLILPQEHDQWVAEKVKRLPMVGLPYRPAHDYLEPMPLPFEKNGFITFGVMSRPLRTNKRVFSVWAEILRKLPNAKLCFDHIPYAEKDLQNRISKVFIDLGINKDQLIFQNTRPHWKAYHEMDIQLDPFPAGSGTTITEGIWMERVAIALTSRPPMGRIAVSQLTALGLDEDCCAKTEKSYVEKAVALATNTERLQHISTGLRLKMQNSRLMDYKAYGSDVAKCYRELWIEHCKSKDML